MAFSKQKTKLAPPPPAPFAGWKTGMSAEKLEEHVLALLRARGRGNSCHPLTLCEQLFGRDGAQHMAEVDRALARLLHDGKVKRHPLQYIGSGHYGTTWSWVPPQPER